MILNVSFGDKNTILFLITKPANVEIIASKNVSVTFINTLKII